MYRLDLFALRRFSVEIDDAVDVERSVSKESIAKKIVGFEIRKQSPEPLPIVVAVERVIHADARAEGV